MSALASHTAGGRGWRTSGVPTRVLVAIDKFRSTATAQELRTTIRATLGDHFVCDEAILSDGGEGFRASFEGVTIAVPVRGPWGEEHEAPVTIALAAGERVAVLEVAEIVGRGFRDAPSPREALDASSAGVADALIAAVARGVDRVVVGCGGSATSDGGEGFYDAWRDAGVPVALTAATDVTAAFLGAMRYAAQKGVASADLPHLERRLRQVAARYARERHRDVIEVPRTGAAGGLAGALYAVGADLVSGFDEVARLGGLRERLAGADVVITGEGRLDAGSLEGKVVAGVCALTSPHQRVLVVCGAADTDAARQLRGRHPWIHVEDLVARFGEVRARHETLACVAEVVGDFTARG